MRIADVELRELTRIAMGSVVVTVVISQISATGNRRIDQFNNHFLMICIFLDQLYGSKRHDVEGFLDY